MQTEQRRDGVVISGAELVPEQTFDCGQCFRWRPDGGGAYLGVASGRAARLSKRDDGTLLLECDPADFEPFWRGYFDLERDYAAVRRAVGIDGYMRRAAAYGAGIRILRQDAWEALCSFILSQCSNIPRIRQMIDTLCRLFGRELTFRGETLYAFPDPETLCTLTEADLAPVHAGYRAKYVLAAAQAVAQGGLDLDGLAQADYETAVRALQTVPGVGKKVADCTALFGLHMLGAFPVDVWIRRTLEHHYGKDFDPGVFAPYGGIAQQYMFYYARSGERMECSEIADGT